MGRIAQAEGLSACPIWAPEPARVPFLNINEQAQECLPHSWLLRGTGLEVGWEERKWPSRPSGPTCPCNRQQQAEPMGRQGNHGQDRPF